MNGFEMSACECDLPLPYTRPTGTVICSQCGGRIVAPVEKKVRA
jgi:hypothetical protein